MTFIYARVFIGPTTALETKLQSLVDAGYKIISVILIRVQNTDRAWREYELVYTTTSD